MPALSLRGGLAGHAGTLRALRPLRVISRFPGLKLVINALTASMNSIMNVRG
jgi:hypothetical protein